MSNLNPVLSAVEELLAWYKAVNFNSMKQILESSLSTDAEKLAYELTQSSNSSRDISKLMPSSLCVSSRSIREWQAKWVRLGLVRQLSPHRRERIFSLSDFGITIPQPVSMERI